jgi:hypothetical protein
MKFTQIACLIGTISTVAATPLPVSTTQVKRDSAVIDRSLRNVSRSLDRLYTSIRSISPRMPAAEVNRRWPDVEMACHQVSDLLWADARDIRRAPAVNALESLSLLDPINTLESSTQRVINEWITIKPAINQSDRTTILRILKDHSTAAQEYSDAILSRQSALTSPVGKYFGDRIKAIIETAIRAYRT